METGLRNKVVLLTGSSDGIARAAADGFAAEGCRLAICSRNETRIRKAADEMRDRHKAEVMAEPLDVTDFVAIQSFTRRVAERFGSIDICLANSGGPPAKNFLSIEL